MKLGRKFRAAIAAGLAMVWAGSAGAVTPGAGGFSWSLQDTGLSGTSSAVAMRNGGVFPVVFNDFRGVAAQFSSGWVPLGDPLFEPLSLSFPLRASSSPDGRVAAIGEEGGVVSLLPFSGFSVLPDVAAYEPGADETPLAGDFDPLGNLTTVSEFGVSGLPGPVSESFNGRISDVAVSVNGDVAVVNENGQFYEYNRFVADWLEIDLNNLSPGISFFGTASVAYDSLGRAHVLVDNGNQLIAADFNPQTGAFGFEVIANDKDTFFSDLAVNDFGVVGTSYEDDGVVYYAFKEGTAAWASVPVTNTNGFQDQTGITFDHEGLPIVSYNDNGNIWIAYDPIVVPEPTATALLGFAGLALLRRRAA
ncbi:MAG: PEP-CTERM sorting domain-containing protein [Planctomycetota bacterium]